MTNSHRFLPTDLPGVVVVEPQVHRDERGFFQESYQKEKYTRGGISDTFVQDNHSRSLLGTLRGLHLQRTKLQAKLVRAIEGEVWDVAVDVRRGSPSFGRWVAATLSAENFRQLYVPAGMAHGFCVVSEVAQVEYKCSAFYDPQDELVVAWNDPDLGIEWPVDDPVLSERDRSASTLADLEHLLPHYQIPA